MNNAVSNSPCPGFSGWNFRNIATVPFIMLAGMFFNLAQADAQSNACQKLSAQLASLNSGAYQKSSPRYREFDDAVRQQQAQLSKTRRIAKSSGCLRRSFFGIGKKSSRCGRILDGIKRMEANLVQLKRAREKFAPRQIGNSGERKRLLKKMQRRGCQNTNVAAASRETDTQSRKRTIVEQIFGVRTYGDDGARGSNEYDADASLLGRYNTFRTLCVRTCDGYYFPISFSTVPSRFERDEQTCQAMCPGSEVLLYHHRMPSEDSEEMISYRSQISYAQQPYAFSYRKQLNQECGCRFSTASFARGENNGAFNPNGANNELRIGLPIYRVDPALAPDTLDNRAGKLTFSVMALLMQGTSVDEKTEMADLSDRKVRIVGPLFFPVQ